MLTARASVSGRPWMRASTVPPVIGASNKRTLHGPELCWSPDFNNHSSLCRCSRCCWQQSCSKQLRWPVDAAVACHFCGHSSNGSEVSLACKCTWYCPANQIRCRVKLWLLMHFKCTPPIAYLQPVHRKSHLGGHTAQRQLSKRLILFPQWRCR